MLLVMALSSSFYFARLPSPLQRPLPTKLKANGSAILFRRRIFSLIPGTTLPERVLVEWLSFFTWPLLYVHVLASELIGAH